jgi:hypothetical protein
LYHTRLTEIICLRRRRVTVKTDQSSPKDGSLMSEGASSAFSTRSRAFWRHALFDERLHTGLDDKFSRFVDIVLAGHA